MLESFEKGRKLLFRQTYEVKSAVANDNVASVEVLWTGTLAVGFGHFGCRVANALPLRHVL
jgi:hypothetical protein